MKRTQILILSAILMISILSFISFAPPIFATIPTGNLRLWYKLDEGTGTTTADASGNGNTGTLTSSSYPPWVTGKIGYGLNFTNTGPGAGADVQVASGDTHNLGWSNAAISWCMWIKPLANSGYYGFDHHVLGAGYYTLVMMPGGSSLYIRFAWYGGTTSLDRSDSTHELPLNNWTHECVTWDNVNVRFYQNSILTSTQAAVGNGGMSGTGTFIFGDHNDNLPAIETLDEFLLYNNTLTQTDIDNIYAYTGDVTTTTTATTTTTNTTTTSSTYTTYNHTQTNISTTINSTTTSMTIQSTQISTYISATTTNTTTIFGNIASTSTVGVVINDTGGSGLATIFMMIAGVLIVAIIVIAYVINKRNQGGL